AGAIRHAKRQSAGAPVMLLSPQGRLLDQAVAEQLVRHDRVILVCGRYEGIDERVCRQMVDQELSIGNYVLSGGELAAMVVMDVVCRLIPGALGNNQSAREDSLASGLLKYPQYTRPRDFEQAGVPEVLLSGDHAAIRRWRRRASIVQTLLKRPELLDTAELDANDVAFLKKLQADVQTIIDRHSETL
ncbi:MAG: tRNA (guanosine(37)-N1)-methyltransferase TrmD, partial [Deltaproteobacteria bacterium]|nr:tRNA (guanosine(37)-N1)-methyltransferase TrmD [Deltaproteobacteria bacterium]